MQKQLKYNFACGHAAIKQVAGRYGIKRSELLLLSAIAEHKMGASASMLHLTTSISLRLVYEALQSLNQKRYLVHLPGTGKAAPSLYYLSFSGYSLIQQLVRTANKMQQSIEQQIENKAICM